MTLPFAFRYHVAKPQIDRKVAALTQRGAAKANGADERKAAAQAKRERRAAKRARASS